MIKKIAWNTFKKTGDIDAFLEYKQIENIENNIKEIQNITNRSTVPGLIDPNDLNDRFYNKRNK